MTRLRSDYEVRVILVGCGYIAQAEHLPGWDQEPRGRLAAVVDTDRSAAEAAGAAYRAPWFTDLGQAIKAVGADAVHVCTPASTHEPLIAEALGAGLHVLAEKPLTDDAASAAALCAQARARELVLMVAAPRLYDPHIEWITTAIDHGETGPVSCIATVWRMSRPAQYRRLTKTARHRPVTSAPGSPGWLRQRLLDQSVHHLGVLARWTRGGLRPLSVVLTHRAYHVVLEADGDVIVTHSNVSPAGHGETFTVYGDAGRFEAMPWSAHFPDVGGTVTIDLAGGREQSQPSIAPTNSYWQQLSEFVDVVRGEGPPRRAAETAVDDVALVEAIVSLAEAQALPGRLSRDDAAEPRGHEAAR